VLIFKAAEALPVPWLKETLVEEKLQVAPEGAPLQARETLFPKAPMGLRRTL
jgi:hypothetical protein